MAADGLDGVEYLPSIPIDRSSALERHSPPGSHDGTGSRYASTSMNPFKAPSSSVRKLKAIDLAIQPLTVQRSTWQNRGHPPTRGYDSYRPDEYSGEQEVYTAPRHGDDFSKGGRFAVSDRYRPSSARYRDGPESGLGTRSPPRRDGDNRDENSSCGKQEGILTSYGTQGRGGIGEAHFHAKPRTEESILGLDARQTPSQDLRLREPRPAKLAARRVQNIGKMEVVFHPETRDEDHNTTKGLQDEVLSEIVNSNNRFAEGLGERGSADAQGDEAARFGLILPPVKMTSNVPLQHEAYANYLTTSDDNPSLAPPTIQDRGGEHAGDSFVESLDEENSTESSARPSFPKVYGEKMDERASRFSTEENASNSSTSGFRNEHLCRACRRLGSTAAPLVHCNACRKGYHNCCGNPKPRESENFDSFTCGKCLKKQESTTSKDESLRSSFGPPSPVDAFVVDPNPSTLGTFVQAVDSSLPSTRQLPADTSEPISISDEDTNHINITSTTGPMISPAPVHCTNNSNGELDPLTKLAPNVTAPDRGVYKQITCPMWKRTGCYLIEAHCHFAHEDTGRDAPYGGEQAKDFTCPQWLAGGTCARQVHECRFAHFDTGFYIGTDGKASLKHITCYYWKTTGRCKKREQDCLYAHRDTGVLAWEPMREQPPPGEHSLKQFICPRWERGLCKWSNTCPYTHSWGGRSCPNSRRTTGNRFGDGSEQASADSFPPKAKAPFPTWAASVRQHPISVAERPKSLECRTLMLDEGSSHPPQGPKKSSTTHGLPPFNCVVNYESNTQAVATPPRSGTSQVTAQTSIEKEGLHSTTIRPAPFRRVARRSGVLHPYHLSNNKLQPIADSQTDHRKSQQRPTLVPQSQSATGGNSVDSPFSNPTPDTMETGIKRMRNCEGCGKLVIGSVLRCARCSIRHSGDLTPPPTTITISDDEDTDDLRPPPTTITISDDEDTPDSLEMGTEMNDLQPHSSTPALRQHVTTLKRHIEEDSLFVSRKRFKPNQTSMDDAMRSLRQDLRNVEVQADLDADTLGSLFEGSNSLEVRETPEREASEEKSIDGARAISPMRQSNDDSASKSSTDSPATTPSPQSPNLGPKAPTRTLRRRVLRSNSTSGLSGQQIEATTKQADLEIEATVPSMLSPSAIEFLLRIDEDDGPDPPEKTISSLMIEDDFTQEEHDLFVEAYNRKPKAFGQIAQSLQGRTYAECVRHYYATKRNVNYKQYVKRTTRQAKAQASKKKGQKSNRSRLSDGHEAPIAAPTRDTAQAIAVQKEKTNRHENVPENQIEHKDLTSGRRTDVTPGGSAAPAEALTLHPRTPEVPQTPIGAIEQVTASPPLLRYCPQCSNGSGDVRCSHNMDGFQDPLNKANEEEGDEEHEVAPTHSRSLTSSRELLTSSSALSRPVTEVDEDVIVAQPLRMLRESSTSSVSSLTGSVEPQPSVSARPSKIVTFPVSYREPASQGSNKNVQAVWTDEDEARATGKLRARGVIFESDDDEPNDQDTYVPPPRRVDPLWQPQKKSRNLFEVDPSLLTLGDMHKRPSKKRLINDFLKYQCRQHKKQFSDPHQEVCRHPEDVQVTTVAQKEVRSGTRGARAETGTVTMSFREFLGAPKKPVINLRGSQVVFLEGDQDKQPSSLGRGRRIPEGETFPFVYDTCK